MISKGIVIFTIGIVGTITTVVLWLISVFRTPDDIKTYFIYDDSGDITMINKTIRLNENTTKEKSNTEINSYEYGNEEFDKSEKYSMKNEDIDKIRDNHFKIDETEIDNAYLEIDETVIDKECLEKDGIEIDNKYLEIDETQIDIKYLEMDETEIDNSLKNIN